VKPEAPRIALISLRDIDRRILALERAGARLAAKLWPIPFGHLFDKAAGLL